MQQEQVSDCSRDHALPNPVKEIPGSEKRKSDTNVDKLNKDIGRAVTAYIAAESQNDELSEARATIRNLEAQVLVHQAQVLDLRREYYRLKVGTVVVPVVWCVEELPDTLLRTLLMRQVEISQFTKNYDRILFINTVGTVKGYKKRTHDTAFEKQEKGAEDGKG